MNDYEEDELGTCPPESGLLFYNDCEKYPNAFGCKGSKKVPLKESYTESLHNFIDNACAWGLLEKGVCSSINNAINNGLITEENIEKIKKNEISCPREISNKLAKLKNVSLGENNLGQKINSVALKSTKEDLLSEINKETKLSVNQYI